MAHLADDSLSCLPLLHQASFCHGKKGIHFYGNVEVAIAAQASATQSVAGRICAACTIFWIVQTRNRGGGFEALGCYGKQIPGVLHQVGAVLLLWPLICPHRPAR